MAKKKREARPATDRNIIGFCSCIAIILAIVITVVSAILNIFKVNAGNLMGILNLIKVIALSIAVCLAAYKYAKGCKKGFRITVYVCIIVYLVLAIVVGAVWL